jgi:hypothetical protein
MDSTERSIFFLSPGMTPVDTSLGVYNDSYSVPFVDKIADRLAAGVDVKFVWGDKDVHRRTLLTWHEINVQ